MSILLLDFSTLEIEIFTCSCHLSSKNYSLHSFKLGLLGVGRIVLGLTFYNFKFKNSQYLEAYVNEGNPLFHLPGRHLRNKVFFYTVLFPLSAFCP